MKGKQFTEEIIIAALKEHQTSANVSDLARFQRIPIQLYVRA